MAYVKSEPVITACAKPASATPATVTANSGVLVRRRKEASCSVGSASGAAEKPKITRKTPSCSASPQMTRDLGDVRCYTRCMLRMVTRPISVKVVVTCGAKMRDTYSTAETGMRRTVPWWQAALRRRCALT